MSRLLISLFITAGIALTGCATAQRPAPQTTVYTPPVAAQPISKDAYDAAIRNAEAQGKTDKDACASRSGNAKDICMAQASGKEKIAKADAEAAYKGTPKAREEAREPKPPTALPRKGAMT
jgi:hypothetical protein